MSNKEIKEIIKLQEPSFLPVAKNRRSYICPFCGNGSGKDGDGITHTRGKKAVYCFKCRQSYDNFALIGEQFGLTSFQDQYKKACELYGLDGDEKEVKMPTPLPSSFKPEPEEKPADHTDEFQSWNKALNDGENPGLAYMQARGLSLETLNRFNVGYAASWKHPKTEHLKKVPSSPRVIIPTSATSYLARDPRDPEKLSDSQKKYVKSKVGKAHLFNEKVLHGSEDVIFLVEGEIDAMSIHEVGGTAVGLGSASNRHALLELAKDLKPSATLIILPDNDEAGKAAAEEIQSGIKELGLKSFIANIFGDCKDANELLQKDPARLRGGIEKLRKKATRTPHMPVSVLDIENRCLMKHLNLHERHVSRLKELGLTEEQIISFGYRSAPSAPVEVCKDLKRSGCALKGNPVFTEKDGKWSTAFPSSGILIPVRNSKGKVQSFEFLPDEGKVQRSGDIHFRKGGRGISEAVILDSALEADIVCSLSGYSVLAIPTDIEEGLLNAALKVLYSRGLRKAHLSYDLWLTATGAEDRRELAKSLKSCGISAVGMKTENGRLSDYLLQQR